MPSLKEIFYWARLPIGTIYFIALREIDFWRSTHSLACGKPLKGAFNSPLWSAKSKESQED